MATTDKDGALVIMDLEKYIKEANRQLPDKRIYKTLQEDPMLQHSNLVNDAIDRFFHPWYIKKQPRKTNDKLN